MTFREDGKAGAPGRLFRATLDQGTMFPFLARSQFMHGSFLTHAMLLGLTLCVALVPSGARAGGTSDGTASPQARRVALVAIAPGTIVGNQPPRTWTHLVIKSVPRLASGDLARLPKSAFRTATLIRTVILADVRPLSDEPSRFVLRRVGVGLCIPDPSRGDVTVDPRRPEASGLRLGMMDKIVLQTAEAKLAQGRLIARSPSFALYHGPSVLELQGVHRKIELYYAFMVDERSGALRVLVWPEAKKGEAPVPARLVELKPGCIFDCPLSVKAERLLGAVPVSWSFAMKDLPPGRSLPVSSELRRDLGAVRSTLRDDPDGLEQALRRAVSERLSPVQGNSGGS